jgi:hypothetical protein
MARDRFTIASNDVMLGNVTYWKSGNHYYKHNERLGGTRRILKGEYEMAKAQHNACIDEILGGGE